MPRTVNICTGGECNGECYKCRLSATYKERDQALAFAFRWAEREYTAGHWGPWVDNFEQDKWLWEHPDAPWNRSEL